MIGEDLIVGNNGGTNYPDRQWQQVVTYYRLWQSTGNEDYREWAYEELGRLVHAIEDQGCPPHAWYAMHGSGSAHGSESFESISYTADYTPIYPYMVKPSLNDPWEYYYWLKDWTVRNMWNPMWRQYWTLGGYGSVEYSGSDGAEAWLMCVQWGACQQAIYWFLVDAQTKLDDPGYTVEQALGDGIRVVLFDSNDYNCYSSPEYTFSQAIVYEPNSNYGAPMLDGNFYKTRNGGLDSIESSDMGFMAGRISSIDMRGDQALIVTIYSEKDFNGDRQVLENSAADLAILGFDNKAQSMKIEWDPYPPTCGYSLSGSISEYGWYNSDMVTITATDDGSGLAEVVYKLDSDTDWTNYETPLHLEDGVHTLYIEATDNAGNTGLVTATIKVDTVAPQTTLNLSINQYGWARTDLVGLNASDSLSGVAETLYKLDADDWVKYTGLFQVPEGEQTILYKSVDMAGNVEAEHSVSFGIDVTRPVITVNAPGMAQYYLDDTMAWDWTAKDQVSGLLSKNGPEIGYHIDTSTLGEHSYTITASDRAGNSVTRTVTYTVVAAPTAAPTPAPIVTPAPAPTVTPTLTPDTGDTGGAATPTPAPGPVAPSTEKTSGPNYLWLIAPAIVALAIVSIWYFTRQK